MAALPRFDRIDQERQDLILHAAKEEFAAHGLEQASINRIIERAGTSKGSMYYYFESKEDLFITALSRSMLAAVRQLTPPDAEGLTAETFWAEADALAQRWTAYIVEHPLDMRLWRTFFQEFRRQLPAGVCPKQHLISGELGVDPALVELFVAQRGHARAFIIRGQTLGLIRGDLEVELILDLIGALDAVHARWMMSRWEDLSADEIQRCTAQVMDMFRRLLAA